MKQALYWLAAGVVAMGLNNVYRDGSAEWAHVVSDRVISRSEAVLALASGRADRFLASAQLARAQEQTVACRFATALARIQTQVARTQTGWARVEAMMARQEADLARLEANRARLEAGRTLLEAQTARLDFASASFGPAFSASFGPRRVKVPVVCPRIRVNISRPIVSVPMPVVHVETVSPGPV